MDFMQAIQEVIPEFKSEVVAVQSSFEKQILSGSIVKPFFVPFDKDNKKPLANKKSPTNTAILFFQTALIDKNPLRK